MSARVRIPVLEGDSTLDSSHFTPMPILQLKKLEVDRVRYEQWRAACDRDRKRARAKTAKEGGAP